MPEEHSLSAFSTGHPLAGFPPKLFVIGAQKCGTTALCEALQQRLPVDLSEPKEPAFFTRNYEKGTAWYRSCFHSEDRVLLDGTPGYTMAQRDPGQVSPHDLAVERMLHISPQARLIYVVRDPVRRAWAGYWHAVRAGNERRSVETAFQEESAYIRASLYDYQLSRFLGAFPRQHVLCVDHAYFLADPDAVIHGIARWLDLTVHEADGQAVARVNATYRYNAAGRFFTALIPSSVLSGTTRLTKALVPESWVVRLKSALTAPVPELDRDTAARIQAHVEADYEAFLRRHRDLFLDGRLPRSLKAPS